MIDNELRHPKVAMYCKYDTAMEDIFLVIAVDDDAKTYTLTSNSQTFTVKQSDVKVMWTKSDCSLFGGNWIDYQYVKNNKPTKSYV